MSVLVKHEGKVQEALVESMSMETLRVKLLDGTIIERNYHEVQRLRKEEDE